MDTHSVTKAYDTYAPLYDLVFGHSLSSGRRSGVECMKLEDNQRVLEVGVGTGLSLDLYPQEVRKVGIDISPEMLIKARKRVERKKVPHVEELACMDAQAMTYEDNSFDAVIAMYIMAVVPDPFKVMEEMKRVCRPGGHIVIVNYFRTGNGKFKLNEWVVKPLGKMFHFHFGLHLDDFVKRAELDVIESFRANIFSHTSVLHCRNGSIRE